MYENQMKALHWLANMFPYTHPVKSETDKMSNCIHLYCEQGANAIQELENTIAGLREVIKGFADDMPHWIPCSERLPEEDGCYLVAVKNDHKRRYSKTAWFSHDSWFARQDVTHWMPLPEPPKEE